MTTVMKEKLIKKRKYSRAGCQGCKKRKIKCDEAKPACQNCSKAGKPCSFTNKGDESNHGLNGKSDGSAGTVPKMTIINSGPTAPPMANPLPIPVQMPVPIPVPFQASPGLPVHTQMTGIPFNPHNGELSFPMAMHDSPVEKLHSSVHGPGFSPQSSHAGNGSTNSLSGQTPPASNNNVPPMSYDFNYPGSTVRDQLFSGASVLAHDLNDLLDVKSEDLVTVEGFNIPGTTPSVVTPGGGHVGDEESLSNLIAAFDMVPGHKNYLRLFYEKYSLWLMPLSADPGPRNFFNKIIIHRAQEVPFLFNAVFAITASFEYKESGSAADEYYKRYYINLSLKGLNSIFQEKAKVMENIEPLILTSLLYVTDSASTTNGSWRDHLRGSNNLFRQYLTATEKHKRSNPTILLATAWFASFEIIAVVTNPGGGSINNQDQLHNVLSPILDKDNLSLAIQIGFVLPNGYNVFLGQSSANIKLFIHFLKLTIKIRSSESKVIESDDLVELMALFDRALKFFVASQDGIIEASSPYYPDTGGMSFLPLETYGYTKDIVFSWFDLSDKIHVRGLYLRVLTNKLYCNMPTSSHVVQDVVKKILDMCHFFNGVDFESDTFDADKTIASFPVLQDRRMLMLHSSMLVCGLCAITKIDRLKIDLYFKSLISTGARTVGNSYKTVLRCWEGGEESFDFVPYL